VRHHLLRVPHLRLLAGDGRGSLQLQGHLGGPTCRSLSGSGSLHIWCVYLSFFPLFSFLFFLKLTRISQQHVIFLQLLMASCSC
jgi:hypothetical protein